SGMNGREKTGVEVTQTDLVKPGQALTRGAKWAAWGALVLSLPLIAAGLWISLAWAEPVYRTLAALRPKIPDGPWHAAIVARVIAWAILLLAFSQVVCCVQALRLLLGRSVGNRAGRLLTVTWAQLSVLFVLVVVWLNLMMGSVTLMNGLHDRTPPNDKPTATEAHP
ncbi:MAG TPA: hypothetical protein VN541_07145, partial [Tepidisphaeraceae bacterium]|nr:hypothetical protein [Tepidisphaeraceae bacterium]